MTDLPEPEWNYDDFDERPAPAEDKKTVDYIPMFSELGKFADPARNRMAHNSIMDEMYADHGRHVDANIPGPERKCGDCVYLEIREKAELKFSVCKIAMEKATSGWLAWDPKWAACGHFLPPVISEVNDE